MFKKTSHIFLGILILASLFLGLWKLSEVPPGVSHDELEYINNGYSIYKTGKDLYGDFLPISIGGVGYVAIPAYVAGLPTLFFGINEWSVRLMPVLFGAIEVFLIYGITKTLFKSEKIALASAFIFTFSTWSLKMSRVIFDPPVSMFFYLLGIYFFLKSKSIKAYASSLVILSLGTLSYYGSLFVFPLVLGALFIYRWQELVKIKKQFLIIATLILSVFGLILVSMLFNQSRNERSQGRSTELIFLNKTDVVDNVIYDRSLSTSSEFTNKIFVNKATYIWRKFFMNYLEAFSPRMIFVEGDPNTNIGLWSRGELAVLDFPLVLLGFYFLFKKYKKGALFVGSLILIAPVTSGLSTPAYATRAFLMWPALIIFAGGGLAFFWDWAKNTKFKTSFPKLILVGFLLFYSYFTLAKLHQYYFRYPTYAKEIWFDSEKQLAFYLMEHSSEKIDIYSLEAREMFMEYFFFSKMDPKVAQEVLPKNRRETIEVGNFRFITGCTNPETEAIKRKTIVHTRCQPLYVGAADQTIKTREGAEVIKWAIYVPE